MGENMRKRTAVGMALLLLLSALTGCSSGTELASSDTKSGAAAETVETIPDASESAAGESKAYVDENVLENKVNESNAEKYQIKGTDAFYVLPTGTDLSEGLLNFTLLDLVDEKITIYAYQALYSLSDSSGQGGMPKAGTRAEYSGKTEAVKDGNTQMVTVIMMYNTESQKYQVIMSQTDAVTVSTTTDSRGVSSRSVVLSDQSGRAKSTNSLTDIYTQKLNAKDDQGNVVCYYYLYYAGVGYFCHYDAEKQSGVLDMTGNINAALILAFNQALEKENKKVENTSISILGVTADSDFYQYVSFVLSDSSEKLDENMEEDDVEKEADTGVSRYITCCFGVNFGTKEGTAEVLQNRFRSTNKNFQAQKDAWMSIDGQTVERTDLEKMDIDAIRGRYPDSFLDYTYVNDSITAVLYYSTEEKYYRLSQKDADLSEMQNISTGDLSAFRSITYGELNTVKTATKNLSYAGLIRYKISEGNEAERFFLFQNGTKVQSEGADTEKLTRSYTVHYTKEETDENGQTKTVDVYEKKSDSEELIQDYWITLSPDASGVWTTNEKTAAGLVPSMGKGYLRYMEDNSTHKVTFTRVSGTQQQNSSEKTDVSVKGDFRNAFFLQPANVAGCYLVISTSEEVEVLRYNNALDYLNNQKKVAPDAVFSRSNLRFNFKNGEKEGGSSTAATETASAEKESTTAESSTTKASAAGDQKESTEDASEEDYENVYSEAESSTELMEALSSTSVDILPGTESGGGDIRLLAAGTSTGLKLIDLSSAGEKKDDDWSSMQLLNIPCYAVFAGVDGKSCSVIGYDTDKYSYSSNDLYKAKLYKYTLFNKEMCYNMVMSMTKKSETIYNMLLSDSDSLLTSLKTYWKLDDYNAKLGKAKLYISYQKVVKKGKTQALSDFCRLAGIDKQNMSTENQKALLNCTSQTDLERLMRTIRKDLEKEIESSASDSGSGVSISKTAGETKTADENGTADETKAAESTAADSKTSAGISKETTKELQELQKLRSILKQKLNITDSEWNDKISSILDNLHPADTLEGYITESTVRSFATLGGVDYDSSMATKLKSCSTWQDAENLLGSYRLSTEDRATLSRLEDKKKRSESSTGDLSTTESFTDDDKASLALLEKKRTEAINTLKADVVQRQKDEKGQKLSEKYGNKWNSQWESYWEQRLTEIMDAAKS